MTKHFSDSINLNDLVGERLADVIKRGGQPKNRIRGGYGLHTNPKTGLSELDEVVFEQENTVVIDGVQYALENIFGVKGTLQTLFLNDTDGIGSQLGATPTPGSIYPVGHRVCLFGIGNGGAAMNNSTVEMVPYNRRTIPGMIPFRHTNDQLTGNDVDKYFGKKNLNGKTAYYAKRMDNEPTIVHFWLDGNDNGKVVIGTQVDNNVYTSNRTEKIQSFAQCSLTVCKNDVKEYYANQGLVEQPCVNVIALMAGVYNPTADDYDQLFIVSELNIPTEPLALSKDLHIIYDFFGS